MEATTIDPAKLARLRQSVEQALDDMRSLNDRSNEVIKGLYHVQAELNEIYVDSTTNKSQNG